MNHTRTRESYNIVYDSLCLHDCPVRINNYTTCSAKVQCILDTFFASAHRELIH